VDEEDGDDAPEADAVPSEPTDQRWLVAAEGLVVLGAAEALGLEPERHQDQGEAERDERAEALLHA
jgi:hypothetical protein